MDKDEFERMRDTVVSIINTHIDSEVLDHGPDWTKSWYDFSLAWAKGNCNYILIPPEQIPRIIAKTKESSEVFDLATFVVGTRLKCGVPIPEGLLEFVSDYLMGKTARPSLGRGRPSKNTWGRDFILIDVMEYLTLRENLPLTQNRERSVGKDHQVSLSEIVEKAVQISKLPNLSRTQIEKIWGNRKKRLEHQETCRLEINVEFDDVNDIVRV